MVLSLFKEGVPPQRLIIMKVCLLLTLLNTSNSFLVTLLKEPFPVIRLQYLHPMF